MSETKAGAKLLCTLWQIIALSFSHVRITYEVAYYRETPAILKVESSVPQKIYHIDIYGGPEKGRLGILVIGDLMSSIILRIRRVCVPAFSGHKPRP